MSSFDGNGSEYWYSRDASGGDRDLLALFRTGGDHAISGWDNAILADRIAIVFFGDDLRTANGRAHQEIADNPRYVEVRAQEARHIERIEMLIQYYSLDDVPALLPVRFEHEFIRS
ncbi:MAG: hypothetical protein FWC64_09490 [Treponema sp.]|nr:hypothetical protein [Treponema sp.]